MPKDRPLCFYHRTDLDGICSGAIIKRALDCDVVDFNGLDYADDFNLDECDGRDVYMVDVSLQPFSRMLELLNVANSLTWIDHHKEAVKDANEAGFDRFAAGAWELGSAACELTWKYFFLSEPTPPRAVRLLGRYDVWDHDDPDVLAFQYGARLYVESGVHDRFWKFALDPDGTSDSSEDFVDEVLQVGKKVLKYQTQVNAKVAHACAFETTIDGLRAIAANYGVRGTANSKVLDSAWDPDRHDLKILFYLNRDGRWEVSLYTEKDRVDCGAIAKKYGGGGHKGAAGFSTNGFPLSLFRRPGA